MKIRLSSKIQPDSVVDGYGVRTLIWTQGCPHRCLGCHNPQTHDFDKGKLVDVKKIIKKLSKLNNQDGITLTGGEPFAQPIASAIIAESAKKMGLNVWCYTGYTFEEILELAKEDGNYIRLLQAIDVLIDGPFILSQQTFNLEYRGSSNQRIIDVSKSLKNNKVCLLRKNKEIYQEAALYQKPKGIFV